MSFLSPGHSRPGSNRQVFRAVYPIILAGFCLYLVFAKLGHIQMEAVAHSLSEISAFQWVLAILATAFSFAAVSQYDVLFHRMLRTGVDGKNAAVSGAASIAIAQTLGFGLITGTLARWRSLASLSAPKALALTNYVSVSFMVALGILSALALPFLPVVDGFGAAGFACISIVFLGVTLSLSLIRPAWCPIELPSARLSVRLIVLTAIDTGLAAFAFWILLPTELQIAFPVFFAAFLIALGAGLLSGAPGGVGPFELCFIALLPHMPEAELLAGVLAFRLIYFALPACLAMIVMAKPAEARESVAPQPETHTHRAEAKGLSQQDGHRLIACGGDALHFAEASQMLVTMGDACLDRPLTEQQFQRIEEEAARSLMWPALYRCSARSALKARQRGWATLALSEEAWLEPMSFTTDTPSRRQLRRKLKKAEKAGITVSSARPLPLAQMAKISEEWCRRSGGERGFSMSRFDPDIVQSQRTYLAWANGKLVAFASFHVAETEWALDLMRSADGMPDGTMHKLIATAISDAAKRDISRLSLAAMPLETASGPVAFFNRKSGQTGLRQFKMSFAPKRSRLYLAAPNRALLALASLDILLRITEPAAMSRNNHSIEAKNAAIAVS